MKILRGILIVSVLFILFLSSCRKSDIYTTDSSAKLNFNTSLVQFDTVFTQMGSATMNFKVKNTNTNGVKTNISLAGGGNSYFRINVDGKPGTSFTNKELAGGDSMYVFVEVTLDGSNANTPFIIQDSILFETNGNYQYVKLQAWGQNATYLDYVAISGVLDNTTPYVLMNQVIVPKNSTLTIKAGTKLYCHAGANLVVQGTLIVEGDINNPVIFQGDRLERDITYSKGPGQWQGIYIADSSTGNIISNAIIQNAVFGIYDYFNTPGTKSVAKTTIHNCIIRNMSDFGILGINTNMNVYNTLVYNTGKQAFLADGGNYNLAQCTFDNSNSIFERQSSTFYLTDFPATLADGISSTPVSLSCHSFNVIAYGTQDDEAAVDIDASHLSPMDTVFRGCDLKAKTYTYGSANFVNKDPGYSNINEEDFHLSISSFISGKGWTDFSSLPSLMMNDVKNGPDLGNINWPAPTAPRNPGCYSAR